MNIGIFHTAFVGDIALMALLIEGLVRSRHTVTIFTNQAGIELYREDPRVKSTILISKGKGWSKSLSLFRNARLIAAENLDALLVPHRSATSAFIAKLSGVKKTIAHADTAVPWLYHELRPRDSRQHEAVKCLNLAPEWLIDERLKVELRANSRPILLARPLPKKLNEIIAGVEMKTASYIVVAPGSVWGTKMYPPQRYAEVVNQLLLRDSSLLCFVTGSAGDASAVEAFFKALPQEWEGIRVFNTVGKIPLSELITIIAGAKLLLTNDSAPVHIASGTNTPTVAIFGPTVREFGFWPLADKSQLVTFAREHGSPLPCQPCGAHGPMICPLGHHRCMQDISTATILSAIDTLGLTARET